MIKSLQKNSKKKMLKINFPFLSIFVLLVTISQISCIKEWWEETKVPILNETNFYDIIGKEKYVVVEFFTKACIYCKYLAPEYEKFYELYLTKRDDVMITKIECFMSRKICTDYGVFAYPFIVLYFPESKKMKSVFKYKRTAEELDKWVNIIAPKKNLKQNNKEENKEDIINKNITENDNMTKIEDYIVKQFSEVKKDIIDIEKFLNESYNILNKTNFEENQNDDEDEDENIIEIKITPFFIVKCVGIFFLFKIVLFYLKNWLFKYNPLPKNIHQKN